MSKPRILFVSPRIPFPANSGTKIRIANLLQALMELGEVDLVCHAFPSELPDLENAVSHAPAWFSRLHSIRVVPHPDWPEILPENLRRSLPWRLFAKEGLLYGSFPAAHLLEPCARIAREADLIWAERLYVAHALREYADKIIVDLDDLESVKLAREADTCDSPLVAMGYRREATRLITMEKAAASRYLLTTVCSAGDTTLFGASANRVQVVPNGVDDSLIELPQVDRIPDRLVFVGTLNYKPNVDAVLYFCRDIFPRILRVRPSVVLDIVGSKPSTEVTELVNNTSVFLHANVPEVAPFVLRAALSIVPLRIGGGTRLKILESMALGTPVVSTTIGAEGLDLEHGRHLLLTDTPDYFAKIILDLLSHPEQAATMAKSGIERVRELYLWSTIRHNLATTCQNLIESIQFKKTRQGL
ncbi:MAG: glycosyltransferase [Pseudomonadales bacterium]|nr:glycosyltransferase [Pseudomonadales bacterium]